MYYAEQKSEMKFANKWENILHNFIKRKIEEQYFVWKAWNKRDIQWDRVYMLENAKTKLVKTM